MSNSAHLGLRPFYRDEADIFFVRNEQVDQLLIRLCKSRFRAVVDPSGCSKSSLVLPACEMRWKPCFCPKSAGLHLRIATMQPGSHPMSNLASTLIEHIGLDTELLNTGMDCGDYPLSLLHQDTRLG